MTVTGSTSIDANGMCVFQVTLIAMELTTVLNTRLELTTVGNHVLIVVVTTRSHISKTGMESDNAKNT